LHTWGVNSSAQNCLFGSLLCCSKFCNTRLTVSWCSITWRVSRSVFCQRRPRWNRRVYPCARWWRTTAASRISLRIASSWISVTLSFAQCYGAGSAQLLNPLFKAFSTGPCEQGRRQRTIPSLPERGWPKWLFSPCRRFRLMQRCCATWSRALCERAEIERPAKAKDAELVAALNKGAQEPPSKWAPSNLTNWSALLASVSRAALIFRSRKAVAGARCAELSRRSGSYVVASWLRRCDIFS